MTVLFFGVFPDQGIFPLVIHSGTFASCRHLLNKRGSLSWMDVHFKTRFPGYHYRLELSISVHFSVYLWAIPFECPPQFQHQVLVILLSFYLYIRPFCYVLCVPIFNSKLFFFLCTWLLVSPRAFSNLLFEFSFVILKKSILFAYQDSVSISFEFLLIVYFGLFFQVAESDLSTLLFWSFHPDISSRFFVS